MYDANPAEAMEMPFEHTTSKPEDAPTTVWLPSFRIRNLGAGQNESFAGMHPQSEVEGCWMAKIWCSCISGRPIQCSWQEIGNPVARRGHLDAELARNWDSCI